MLASFVTQPVFSAATVKALEEQTLARLSDADALVKQAGAALAQQIQKLWPQAQRVAIFCGSGNNGADGYSLAQELHGAGVSVLLVALGQERTGTASMQRMKEACLELGLEFCTLEQALCSAQLVVDAMLGNGIRAGALPADYCRAIKAINTADVPVLAVDVPTGMNADTGQLHKPTIVAQHTVVFIGYRLGHTTGTAAYYCGSMNLEPLTVNTEQAMPKAVRVVAQHSPFLPPRPIHSHKGSHGHLLVIGGDHGMGGAALLAASAALHAGAGKVTVLTRNTHLNGFLAHQPELMVHGVEDGERIQSWLESADAVVLGPGLGQQAWGQALFEQAFATSKPLLCDADGINWCQRLTPHPRAAATVFTPHPGEAARLLGQRADQVQQHRFQALQDLMNKLQATVVLKGNGTLVSRQEAPPLVLDCGNPGMAVAGMGDVLSGIIGALLAQGIAADEAAFLGAWWHGHTADLLARGKGQVGLLPTEVIATLWEALPK